MKNALINRKSQDRTDLTLQNFYWKKVIKYMVLM